MPLWRCVNDEARRTQVNYSRWPVATRLVEIHDRCTEPGCDKVLHSIREGESGLCGSCAFKKMPQDTKRALNRLLAAGFNGADDVEKTEAVKEAMEKVKRDGDK